MKKILTVTALTPFILGNSAGTLGALLPLAIGATIGLVVIIGIVWGACKFFKNS